MNNSSVSQEDMTSSPFLILSVNISMAVVVLAFLCHLTAVFTLLRPTMRRKIMTPFMINLCVISLIMAVCGYSVTLGTNLKEETENNTREAFLCNWVAYVGILCKCAFSSTLCAMNAVSTIAADRCSHGAAQPISRKSNMIVFLALWLYPFIMGGIPFFAGNLFRLSASELTCQQHWPSKESSHNFYNTFTSIMTFLLPMVICFVIQYLCSRIWKTARNIENVAIRRRLVYRRKLNRMVVALTVYFFASHLPYHVSNLVAMVTGHYTFSPETAFALELVAQSNILSSPFVFLFLNTRYRTTLKELLTGTGGQRLQNANQRGANVQRPVMTAHIRQPGPQRRVKFSSKVEPSPRPADPHRAPGSSTKASCGASSTKASNQAGTASSDYGISTSASFKPELQAAESGASSEKMNMINGGSSEQNHANNLAQTNMVTTQEANM